MAKIQVCLQTFEFFRSQTLISCVYLDCVVHGQSNKSNIKVSALQASVCKPTCMKMLLLFSAIFLNRKASELVQRKLFLIC